MALDKAMAFGMLQGFNSPSAKQAANAGLNTALPAATTTGATLSSGAAGLAGASGAAGAAGASGAAGAGFMASLAAPGVGTALMAAGTALSSLMAGSDAEKDRQSQEYQAQLAAKTQRESTAAQQATAAAQQSQQSVSDAGQMEGLGQQGLGSSLDRFFR